VLNVESEPLNPVLPQVGAPLPPAPTLRDIAELEFTENAEL
jgi:hypothetical protein